MTVSRRQALAAAGAAMLAPRVGLAGVHQAPAPGRAGWIARARTLAEPVLTHLAAGSLRARMPVEQAAHTDRTHVTHLEAFGRLLAGIAPWIEAGDSPYRDLALQALDRAVDPASPDYMNFTRERQPVVDAAFLVQGLLRAPASLLAHVDGATKKNLIAALESTRTITPAFSNWLLFSAMVEAGLDALGAPFDATRVEYAVREHEQWYKGDGAYGDGPQFHWDYYNSFVIHPMLLDVLRVTSRKTDEWKVIEADAVIRARRYAAIQERFVSPEGTFPPIGRSLAYRCGAFQLLGQMALRHDLPDGVRPAQVRGALSAVIDRTMNAPGTFDSAGWLTVGFAGHQPKIGESYISSGSAYLCAVGFLPLGLPASDPFWSAPPEPWTAKALWQGVDLPTDHALG